MFYYQRHIGDYAASTGHLTAEEHGAMTLLLDRYYLKEEPIADVMAARIAKVDREIVLPLLQEFFTLSPEGWRHAGADADIAKYHENAAKSRQNGKNGGRPPKKPPADTKPKANPPGSGDNPAGSEEKPKKTKPVKKSRPRIGEENFSAGFTRFVDAYPASKRSKKMDAWERWQADDMEEFADAIVGDVIRRKTEHWGWVKEEGKFIPGMQVYLNGRRWNDAIEPVPGHSGPRSAVESANQQTAEAWAHGGNGNVE